MKKKNGETVAQFKFTVLILRSSTTRLNEGFPLPFVTSEYKIDTDPTLSQIMAMSTKRNKKKKKKKTNQNNQNNQEEQPQENNQNNQEEQPQKMDE